MYGIDLFLEPTASPPSVRYVSLARVLTISFVWPIPWVPLTSSIET